MLVIWLHRRTMTVIPRYNFTRAATPPSLHILTSSYKYTLTTTLSSFNIILKMPTSNQSNSSNVKSYKIASIPGDGIGPDVISAGIKILDKLTQELGTFSLEFTHFDWSSAYYKKYGKYLPDNALEVVRGFEALFFGCVGDVGVWSFCLIRGPRLIIYSVYI